MKRVVLDYRRLLKINIEAVDIPIRGNFPVYREEVDYFDCPVRTRHLRKIVKALGINDLVANCHIDEYFVESVEYDEKEKTEFWGIGH